MADWAGLRQRTGSKIRTCLGYFLLPAIVVAFSLATPRFLTRANVSVILEQSAVLLIVGIGVTFVILAGSIDLSVGSVLGLSAGVAALLVRDYGLAGGIGALAVGTACGLINGVIFAKGRIPSFIVTLGMLTVARGVLLIVTGATTILVPEPTVRHLGAGANFGLPNIFLVFLALFALSSLAINRTPLGSYVKAVGGGERVAWLSGVKVDLVKIAVMGFSGFMAGLGGVLAMARIGASSPSLGTGFELDVITAVVLGGTTLTGGVGNLTGTLVGGLVMATLNNGFNILGLSPYLQMVLKGAVIILAVLATIDRSKIGIIK